MPLTTSFFSVLYTQLNYFYYINIYKYYSVPFLHNGNDACDNDCPELKLQKFNPKISLFTTNLFNCQNVVSTYFVSKSFLIIPYYSFFLSKIVRNVNFFIKSKKFLSRILYKPIRFLTFNLVIKNTRTNFFVFFYRKIYNLKQTLFRKLNTDSKSIYTNNRLNKLEASFKSSYTFSIFESKSENSFFLQKITRNWEMLFFSSSFTFKSKPLLKKKKRSGNRKVVKAYLKYLKFMKYKIFFFSSGGYDSCRKKFRRSSTRIMLFIRRLKRKLIPKFFKKKMDIFNVIFNGRMRKYRKYVKAVRAYFYKRYKSFRWMYNQIKEVRALIYINTPIREINRHTRSISFSVFKYFNSIRKKIYSSFFFKRPKRFLRSLVKINDPISTCLFFSITIYFFILKQEVNYQKIPFFINFFSKKRTLKLMRKKSVNYDLIHYTKHQLLTTYKSKARDLIYYPWNWITSSEKRNKKKKHRTFFTRAYWKLKKQISSKLIILPLKIFILDVTSYPFNGCKRVKRYVKKRNKKTT